MTKKVNRPKKTPTGDYPVGYCKPSEETRWKKGCASPNPGGRPPKKPDLYELVYKHMHEEQSYTENGERKTTARIGFALLALYKAAVAGDVKAIKMFLELTEKAERHHNIINDPFYFPDHSIEEIEKKAVQAKQSYKKVNEDSFMAAVAQSIISEAKHQGKSVEEILQNMAAE